MKVLKAGVGRRETTGSDAGLYCCGRRTPANGEVKEARRVRVIYIKLPRFLRSILVRFCR